MTLPLCAVAGGSSQLGRAIITALLEAKSFTPVVLSRATSTTPAWLEALPVEVRGVDYFSEKSCVAALANVHTVVSTLLCKDGTWYTTQKNLLDAGLKAGIKRFVPSDFGVGPASWADIELFALEQAPLREALQAAARDHPGFEWTAFYNGAFTNYLGYGCENQDADALDHSFLFNVKDMTADLPVNDRGRLPDITMTTISDTARFVAAACELAPGTWSEESYLVGETINMGTVLAIIESVRGRSMSVTKHTKESLRAQIDQIPADSTRGEDIFGRFFLQLTLAHADGEERKSVMPPALNSRLPHIKTVGVEDYVRKYWS